MSDPGMASVRNAMDAHLAAHVEHDQVREQTAGAHYADADAQLAEQLAAQQADQGEDGEPQ